MIPRMDPELIQNEFIMDTKMVSQFIPKWIVDECENVSKWDINIDQYCSLNESKMDLA